MSKATAKPAASQMGGNAVSGDNSNRVSVVRNKYQMTELWAASPCTKLPWRLATATATLSSVKVVMRKLPALA